MRIIAGIAGRPAPLVIAGCAGPREAVSPETSLPSEFPITPQTQVIGMITDDAAP
jgi:hypothetical protein